MVEIDILPTMLKQFRLSTMGRDLDEVISLAENGAWSYRQFLQELCEREEHMRGERKLERLIKQSGLPQTKTLATLNTNEVPLNINKMLPDLLSGRFVESHCNLLAFGLPGRGKTHFLCALGRELIMRHRCSVLFTRTFKFRLLDPVS